MHSVFIQNLPLMIRKLIGRRELFVWLTLLCCFCGYCRLEAKDIRVLFLGNSYIATNNLPHLIQQVAISMGHRMQFDTWAPGGYRLKHHASDPNTLSQIAQGNWDFVVIQEQSQLPSFPDMDVYYEVLPYVRQLDSLIHAANPCARTVFYMTWGRKNGDLGNCGFFPPLCTY